MLAVTRRTSGQVRILFLIALMLLSSPAVATNVPPHIAAAFKRCEKIQRDVEKIRGLAFKKHVKIAVQSREDLRAMVKKELARQFGDAGPEAYIKALVKLGVLEHPIDLEATVLKLLESQAAAYYDIDTKTYCLLMTNKPPQLLDAVSSHELCHALQDQHFDLQKYVPREAEKIRGNGDRVTARQCVIEGEATFVMYVWTMMNATGTHDPASVEWSVGMMINVQKTLEIDEMIAIAAAHGGTPGGEDEATIASLKELTNLPPYFVESMLSLYFDGSAMIKHVKALGGWDAVTALYRTPPESTEQVLHPEKLSGKRDSPVDVRLPELEKNLGGSWRMVEHDVLGELGIRVFLRIWRDKKVRSDAAAVSAAAGWGGDRYYYFENAKSKKDLLVWKTVWDSPREAAEFVVAYRLTLDRRFPGMKKAWRSSKTSAHAYQIWEVEPGRFLKLTRKGAVVGIVDTTDRDATRVIWE